MIAHPLLHPPARSPALRGTGAYDGECCGVRAETLKAAARWCARAASACVCCFCAAREVLPWTVMHTPCCAAPHTTPMWSATYAIHEVDAPCTPQSCMQPSRLRHFHPPTPRWSATFAIHEVDAGYCFATGCNNRTQNLPLAGVCARARVPRSTQTPAPSLRRHPARSRPAPPPHPDTHTHKPHTSSPPPSTHTPPGEEILHGMAIVTGAYSDADPASPTYDNPATLFRATDAAGKCRGGALAGINKLFITATRAASDAAVAGDIPGMNEGIAEVLKTYVARFLQWSLKENAAASTRATAGAKRKADACRKPCIKRAGQAAARVYFKAVEPLIARDHPELAAKVRGSPG